MRHEWRGVLPGTQREILAATELVHAARTSARADLMLQTMTLLGATVLTRDMTLHLRKVRCSDEGHDEVAEAFIVGTAIMPFDELSSTDVTTQSVLRLDLTGRRPKDAQ
jgi:hypothetical protein